ARNESWLREAETLRAQRQARLAAEEGVGAKPLKPQRVYAELRRVLPPETIVALDAGAAPAYGYDRLHFAQPRTFLTPLDLGGLGFAFPAALGAKLGRPEAPVVAVHGDGGFLMNAQELETAVRHNIAAVTIVMNNNCWGSEKAYQKHFYSGRYIGCDIGNPRYDQFARLFGAAGFYVEHPDQVGDAVKAALSAGTPTVPADRPRPPLAMPLGIAVARSPPHVPRGALLVAADVEMHAVTRRGLDRHLARATQERRAGTTEGVGQRGKVLGDHGERHQPLGASDLVGRHDQQRATADRQHDARAVV